MYFKQSDIFWGMSRDFVESVAELAVNVSHKADDILFRAGDSTGYFYILLKGRISLEFYGEGQKLYTARRPGEIIGWSALIRRDYYTATAIIDCDTDLIKVDRESFLKILDNEPECKAILFERVAKMLGNRLLDINSSAA